MTYLQAALVHLVDDHVRDRRELPVDHQPTDEDAGCTEQQACHAAGCPIGVDGVAHDLSDRLAAFLRHALRQRCNRGDLKKRNVLLYSGIPLY